MWLRWEHCVMGLRSSPHGCVKMHSLGEEIVRGDHLDPRNPFFFDAVCLNLPGSPSYNPSVPWVSKVITATGKIAGDMVTYVDDKRPVAPILSLCRHLCQRIASHMCYLGEQDAARKRGPPSKETGAWTGSLVFTTNNQVTVLCTQEKWSKAKNYVTSIAQ
jgi:hypothetical protein